MQPENKKILLTGGLGGIGKPLLDMLLDSGARVTVIGRSPMADQHDFDFIQADLSDPHQLEALLPRVRQVQPDILINLAGMNALSKFENQARDNIHAILQVNLLAPMLLCQTLISDMRTRGSGQIINVGSVLGSIGAPLFAAYSTSKAGLRNFSESLRRELAGSGISVTHINPRAVATPMNHGAISELNSLTGTRVDTPERVARKIYAAMLQESDEVNIGIPEKLFINLNSVLPRLIDDALISNRHVGESVLLKHLQEQTS